MTDILEDLLAFQCVTEEPVVCSKCGRELPEGEQRSLDADHGVFCSQCEEDEATQDAKIAEEP